MNLSLIARSHHRNGVCGDPFDVYLFRDEDGTAKVAVDFGGMSVAVLDVGLLAKGDISFGSNSWRGDKFAGPVRELKKQGDPEVAPGSLFVDWGTKSD